MTIVVIFHGHILIPASSDNAFIGDNIQCFYAVFTSKQHRGQMAQLCGLWQLLLTYRISLIRTRTQIQRALVNELN